MVLPSGFFEATAPSMPREEAANPTGEAEQHSRATPSGPEGPSPQRNPPRDKIEDRDSTICTQCHKMFNKKNMSSQKPGCKKTPVVSEGTVKGQLIALGVREIALSTQTTCSRPAGRTVHFLDNWQATTQDAWVLNTVQGLEIVFSSYPVQ